MKKSVSLILALFLSLSVLSGCQKDKPETEPGKDITQDGGDKEASGDLKKVTILIKDVLPDEENVILLKEKIDEGLQASGKNIEVEFLDSPVGTYREAIPLAIRNNQIAPDIIYFQGGEDDLVTEGFLEDLTPYIEKSEYIKGLMEETNITRMDNYPYILWLAPPRVVVPAMRKDFFDELDIKDEFLADPSPENYKKLFKELNDKGLTEYGLTADGDTSRFDSIFNHAFGVKSTFTKNDDGKWISYMMTQEEKNKLAFYAELYAEGMIDPDYLTNAWDTMEQVFYENKSAIIAGTAGGTIQVYNNKSIEANGESAELMILPPAKGISQSYGSIDNSKEVRGFAIHADSTVKEESMAVLDFMASPEGRMIDKLGIEGTHYNITDNKIEVTDKFTGWWSYFWDTFNTFDPGMEYVEDPFVPVIFESFAAVEKYAYEDTKTVIRGDEAAIWDAIKNLYNEFSADVIRGERSIDEFDDFVEECYANGADKISDYLEDVFK